MAISDEELYRRLLEEEPALRNRLSKLLDSINSIVKAVYAFPLPEEIRAELLFEKQEVLFLQDLAGLSDAFQIGYLVFYLLSHDNYGGDDPVDRLAYALNEASARVGSTRSNCRVIRFTYNSPLEIVFAGIAVWLAVAVVISGGEIQITKEGIKAKLPSLGFGLRKIFEALDSARKLNILRSRREEEAWKAKFPPLNQTPPRKKRPRK